jgi:hypothetical protein
LLCLVFHFSVSPRIAKNQHRELQNEFWKCLRWPGPTRLMDVESLTSTCDLRCQHSTPQRGLQPIWLHCMQPDEESCWDPASRSGVSPSCRPLNEQPLWRPLSFPGGCVTAPTLRSPGTHCREQWRPARNRYVPGRTYRDPVAAYRGLRERDTVWLKKLPSEQYGSRDKATNSELQLQPHQRPPPVRTSGQSPAFLYNYWL